MLLQAGDMLADTLGYWSYENRSSDSGRVIAQEKGGKVNWFNMCAGQVLHFFTAELKSDSKQKLLKSSCRRRRERSLDKSKDTHWALSTNSIRMGETLKSTFLRKQTLQADFILTLLRFLLMSGRWTFLRSKYFCSAVMKMKNGLRIEVKLTLCGLIMTRVCRSDFRFF